MNSDITLIDFITLSFILLKSLVMIKMTEIFVSRLLGLKAKMILLLDNKDFVQILSSSHKIYSIDLGFSSN